MMRNLESIWYMNLYCYDETITIPIVGIEIPEELNTLLKVTSSI